MSDIWERFEQVKEYIPTSRRLYRSSAPYYYFNQKITPDAIKFLEDNKITVIISFNDNSYKADEIALLKDAGITYHHFGVRDFQAATLEQLRDAHAVVDSDTLDTGTGVLVHCGYGHGRTGTGVTGIQLQYTEGANPPEEDWVRVNHVERPVQMAVLRELRESCKKPSGVTDVE